MNTGVEEMVVYVFRALMELKLVLTGPPIPMTKRVERGTISETDRLEQFHRGLSRFSACEENPGACFSSYVMYV
jgi:hypothetical protein